MHREPHGIWRVDYQLPAGEDPEDALRPESLKARIDAQLEMIGFGGTPWEMDWSSVYSARTLTLPDYVHGNILFTGDAAHLLPIFGVRGANTGFQDAQNLGWKLAATLQGWGGPNLIGSYSNERRPIFRETGDDFIGDVIETERKFLDTYNPKKDKAGFEKAWDSFKTGGGMRVHSYEPNYEGSEVVWGPQGGKNSAHGQHMAKARPGHHLTPRPLKTGRDVFQELAFHGFTLLALDSDDATQAAFEAAAKALNVPLKVIRDSAAGGREDYESKLILVRPDQHIAWRGDQPSARALRTAYGI